MGRSIQIKLLPSKKDKIYQPKPDFSDLYVLMNKLHFNSVNTAIEEESPVSELQIKVDNLQEEINQTIKEESTLNIMTDCLENADKSVKKHQLNGQNSKQDLTQIEDFNKILQEADVDIKGQLHNLDISRENIDPEKLKAKIGENLKLITDRKNAINSKISLLNNNILKLETLKENINSSDADIDSLEIALKNLSLQ